MRTSVEWWNNIKRERDELIEWLDKQYEGEYTAHERINDFLATYGDATDPQTRSAIAHIAEQEMNHAEWVGQLLINRGREPQVFGRNARYWNQTLYHIDSFSTGCAVAAHAEKMRLERIKVIADDPKSPTDIREVFQKILPQELMHEEIFRKAAGWASMQATLDSHMAGAEALGLVI